MFSFGFVIEKDGLYYVQRVDLEEAEWSRNPLEAAHFDVRQSAESNAKLYPSSVVREHKVE